MSSDSTLKFLDCRYDKDLIENENYGEDDIDKFRNSIQKDYIVTFKKTVAERGGGNFIIEFLLNLTLQDFLMIILGGVTWDLVKFGTRKFFIKPFLDEYEKFKKTPYAQEIRDIAFNFSNAKLHIYSIINGEPEINFATVSKIFQKLAKVYNKLDIEPTNKLTDIHIPIFHDVTANEMDLFRQKLSVDDPLEDGLKDNIFTYKAYFNFWGLVYFNYQRKIFDVNSQVLKIKNWYTEDDYYWKERSD